MAEATNEQSLLLRERILGQQSDEGSLKTSLALTVGAVTLSAALGLAVSMGGYAREHSLTKSTTTVEGGHGEITHIGTLKLPETYYGVMESNVAGIKASRDNKLFGRFSYGNEATVTLTEGAYTTKIGNQPLDLDYAPGKNGKKLSIAFPLDKLLAVVYPTDPLNGVHLQSDNGLFMAARGNTENIINAIPKLGAHDVNDVYDRLRGTVEFDALRITAEKCAPAGWDYLAPIYYKEVIEHTINQINKLHPGTKLTPEDAEVVPSGIVSFESQYQQQFDDFKTKNTTNGDNFIVSGDSKVSCTVSENVIKETANTAAGSR